LLATPDLSVRSGSFLSLFFNQVIAVTLQTEQNGCQMIGISEGETKKVSPVTSDFY
jgi:hypothetical protein